MEAVKEDLAAPFVRRTALSRYAQKLTGDMERGEGFAAHPALMRSVGMWGEMSFDTYCAKAKSLFLVEDCRGVAQYFLAEILRVASEKQTPVRISHDPILPHRVDGIFFLKEKIAFVLEAEETLAYPHRIISTRRFVDTAGFGKVRGEYNYANRVSEALLDGAIEALGEARRLHFALEEIYAAAMDFNAKENFTKSFCSRLFGLQNE